MPMNNNLHPTALQFIFQYITNRITHTHSFLDKRKTPFGLNHAYEQQHTSYCITFRFLVNHKQNQEPLWPNKVVLPLFLVCWVRPNGYTPCHIPDPFPIHPHSRTSSFFEIQPDLLPVDTPAAFRGFPDLEKNGFFLLQLPVRGCTGKYVVEPQKRSRRRKQSSASDATHHSPSNIQASALHACSVTEPSGSHVAQNVAQPRKRIRRTPQASTQSTNNITETSTSYASPVNEMAYSHATQSARQPQKRNRRTRQSSTGRGNDRSQNIIKGSTSYTPESFSGHGYGSHVSHYHLCCGNGKVFMQPEPDPPEYIKKLLGDATFMENIRAYNQMFAMTSFSVTIDSTVNQGRGPYVFKVSGQIYHRIGSLCPTGDDDPKFLQLYIYDTRNEVRNILNPFSNPDSPPLDPEVVQGLIHFLDTHNELVQIFRTARDKCAQADVPEFKIRLYSGDGPRGYELPSSNTLDGPVKRISKIHKSYMSLQFPLIFIYGQPGFHTKLMLRTANPDDEPKRVSMNAFYTYQLHPRHDSYNLLF
ncbi:helitron helicase-like domain-containing protein [Artemisia annua]|uniref:Helitron helicase-like domain-containing protein n=1 Tax=Artemisia annua TaxID=35608 RepID=A0A2U1QIG3_ARTAN|nr:helitron helicase-like domain-containing protein [Artemisia annua]